jgi:transposase InsO family protein
LAVGHSSFYAPGTIKIKLNQELVKQLLKVNEEHPFYGVRRLALELGWSENKTRRIRNLAKLKIPVASKKHSYRRNTPEILAPANALRPYAMFKNQDRPQDGMDYSNMVNAEAWVQDFSYMKFSGSFCYLAVILDIKTRQVVGWRLGTNHSSELTYAAILDALSKHSPPAILHSDQGSEYLSHKHQLICDKLEIQLSCSDKSSPWQNGFMERWFNTFKTEFGSLSRFKDISEVHEAIALQIHYYNTRRIHLALKTTPANYAKSLIKTSHIVSGRVVA